MTTERIVQIHVAVLTSIGAILLGMGRHNAMLPLMVMFAAASSVIFTDALRWFHLNRVTANLAALLALFLSLDDFFQADSRSQLLAIANLLTYLQIVLFYQHKSERIYWQLSVLSLLQVMVSAALNVGLEFGIVLMAYVAVAISMLGFFFLYREMARVTRPDRKTGRRLGGADSPAQPSQPPDRWTRLLDRTPAAMPAAKARHLAGQLVGWPFLQQLIVIGVTTMLFTFVLFFSAPRLDSSTRESLQMRTPRIVGFSPEVSLNELHSVLQDPTPVMRVTLRDSETDQPYRAYNDIYFRGAVLVEYDASTGVSRWRQRCSGKPFGDDLPTRLSDQANLLLRRVAASTQRLDDWRLPEPPEGVQVVRQDILLAPLDDSCLFSAYPVYRLPETSRDVRINPRTRQMFSRRRQRGQVHSEYHYSVGTTAFRAGLQVDVTPHDNPLASSQDRLLLALEKMELLRFDAKRFPKLRAIADSVVAALGPSPTRVEKARVLERYLLDAPEYEYTLNFRDIPRDRRLDPIEDFVANHHRGHCEYFASALVMMLRSQGIPARMVIGFKGGEYNTLGGYYQVRQSDAHAWVEAFLEPEDVSRMLPEGCDTGPAGGWLRLDPTPQALDDDSEQLEHGLMDSVDDLLDYARLLWSDYVLGLSASRQQASIYEPVVNSANPDVWATVMQRLRSRRGMIARALGRFFFGRLGFIALIGAGLALFWLRLRAHRMPRRDKPRRRSRWFPSPVLGFVRESRSTPPAAVTFYERLEKLLKKLGTARQAAQTPREFAVDAERLLAETECPSDLADLPVRIVRFFYRVRFGGQTLDSSQRQSIDRQLDRLEQHAESQLKSRE